MVMREVYIDEWVDMMDAAIVEGDLGKISFLWSQYGELTERGYFTLPF